MALISEVESLLANDIRSNVEGAGFHPAEASLPHSDVSAMSGSPHPDVGFN